MYLPLTQYTQGATRSYGNKDGTPPNPNNCMALRSHDQGRAGYTYSQCDKKPKAERPARAGRWEGEASSVTIKVCGVHASVHDRGVKKQEEAEAAKKAKEDRLKAAQKACKTLHADWGLKAQPYYRANPGSGLGDYTGEVVIDPKALLEVIQTLVDE